MKKKTNNFDILEIERIIGYTFKDKSLLLQSFTRTSFCNEHNGHGEEYQSNEVLEFFGDGVLSVAIISFMLNECTARYSHGIKTELKEGDFSNLKSKLSDKQNLSKSMKALGLQKYLRMGEGDAKLGIADEPSVMEDLFESIIGAIYVDSDMSMEAVIKSVTGMLDMSVYTDRQKPTQSSKNMLQEWCADKKHRLPPPRYETISEDGPDHKKTYMRACYIGDKLMGRGVGKNFKIADAAAANDALQRLMTENATNMQPIVDNTANNSEKLQKTAVVNKKENPDKKATEGKSVPTSTKSASSLSKLRAYASSQKKPSPTFKDLGQGDNGAYLIECSFDTGKVTGTAATRVAAREASAALMLEILGLVNKKNLQGVKKASAQASKEPKQAKRFKNTAPTAKTPEANDNGGKAAKSGAESKTNPKNKSHTKKKSGSHTKRHSSAQSHKTKKAVKA